MSQLVTLAEPRSAAAEAYRSLRTNLAFARPGEPLNTLLVAAPTSMEPRSTTVANLAVVTAQSGRRVTVVDCDLRRPAQHGLFELENDRGVTTVLVAGEADAAAALQPTSVAGLRVLTSGPIPPNPAELLGSPGMASLVRALAEDADLVLFDAPPLLPVTDAAVLAPGLDGVVLVLESGRSRRDEATRARTVLDNVGARLLGVVLAGLDASAHAYPSYSAKGA